MVLEVNTIGSHRNNAMKRARLHLVAHLLVAVCMLSLVGCGDLVPIGAARDPAKATLSPVPTSSSATDVIPPTDTPGVEQLTATATLEPSPGIHEVQAGDTLWGIAHRYVVSLSDLMAANGIENPDLIYVGQQLAIPTDSDPGVEQPQDPLTPSAPETRTITPDEPSSLAAEPSPAVDLSLLAPHILLEPMSHDWQKFNNCGPVTISMALSYHGREVGQLDIAAAVKGVPEDKNVSPQEIVWYIRDQGLDAVARVNGDIDTLQRLVSNDIPVIVQQWMDRPDHDMTGHYRVLRGYDRAAQVMIVNDSFSGPMLRFSYADFDRLWRGFNRSYIPVYRPEQEALVASIVGDDWDDEAMYVRALAQAQMEVEERGDLYAWFNLGDALLELDRDEEAVAAYEQALAFGLPPRMMWYRFGPLEAYNRVGQYQKTLGLAEPLLADAPMLEEVHYHRGIAYEGLGHPQNAMAAYQMALQHNSRFQAAREALEALQEGLSSRAD